MDDGDDFKGSDALLSIPTNHAAGSTQRIRVPVAGDGNCFFTAIALQLPVGTAAGVRDLIAAEW